MATLEQRVTVLEDEMTQIREEWGVVAQAPLIQARLLNALRETQVEQGADITVLKDDVHGLKQDVHGLKQDVHGLKQDVRELKQGQQTIVGMLTTLIERE